jgi:hypothetical protein
VFEDPHFIVPWYRVMSARVYRKGAVDKTSNCVIPTRSILSESRWDPLEVNARRIELLGADPPSAPGEGNVLITDEHKDRKWGKHTAHVGRPWLAYIGKTDSGVVSGDGPDCRREDLLDCCLRALHPSASFRGTQG